MNGADFALENIRRPPLPGGQLGEGGDEGQDFADAGREALGRAGHRTDPGGSDVRTAPGVAGAGLLTDWLSASGALRGSTRAGIARMSSGRAGVGGRRPFRVRGP